MKLEVIAKKESQKIQKDIISKMRDLINLKNLEPGDKLPSERMLSEKIGVSRNHIREAIETLVFYGLLKSIPQSGTFIANIGVTAMNGMIDDIIRLDEPEFKCLVETRILLELKTSKLASVRRKEDDLLEIEKAMVAYENKVLKGENAVQEDLLFHLAIAKASGNSSLNTFMLIITPKIITNFAKYHVCDEDRSQLAIQEHKDIYNAIKEQKGDLARLTMKRHFKELYKYCYVDEEMFQKKK